MEYTKKPLTFIQQLDLLSSRGLEIPSQGKASNLLTRISYYRLSAYRFPYQDEKDKFRTGVTIDDVCDLYLFDHNLRMLVMDVLASIEIAIRTSLTYHLSHTYGAYGYLDKTNFAQRFEHGKWLADIGKELRRSKETFIEHYKSRHKNTTEFPIWMATEVVSFGSLSRLYAGLKNPDKQQIAATFNIHREVFRTWIHSMVYIRNICAHHSRLWNKQLAIRPDIPEKDEVWKSLFPEPNNRVFTFLTIMNYCLINIGSTGNFKTRLQTLLKENPLSNVHSMGFDADWDKHKLWSAK
jgi:abortive infection bacteriophage resistance protein